MHVCECEHYRLSESVVQKGSSLYFVVFFFPAEGEEERSGIVNHLCDQVRTISFVPMPGYCWYVCMYIGMSVRSLPVCTCEKD